MSLKLSEIISFMEKYAPAHLAEDWDNVGLLVGNSENKITKVMVCLDVTTEVVREAVEHKADLIVSHHPFIFKGLKRINEEDSRGRLIHMLIKNNISVFSAHTNLDVAFDGINEHLAQLLELNDTANLTDYKADKLFKIVVFVPAGSEDEVRNAMSRAGAGWIGNYSDCSYMVKGTGTFKPMEGTKPYIGAAGKLERVEEYRLETIVPQKALHAVVAEMLKVHPYEEAAYDIYPLELKGKQYGMGKVGSLSQVMNLKEFIKTVKNKLQAGTVRLIGNADKDIKTVAVFCGSFDEGLLETVKRKADVLVTGDIKYHTALEIVESGMSVIDAGHFATEHIIVPKLVRMLSERFKDLDIRSNTVEQDPFKFC